MIENEHRFEITKIDSGLIFYTRYFGLLTRGIFFEVSYTRTSDPDYENAVFVVNDMLDTDMSALSVDDIREMSMRVRQVLAVRPHMVVIVIAEDKLSYGLSRIFRGSTGPAASGMYVVQSREAAFEIINAVRAEREI